MWSSQQFGKDATIGRYGCTLTCISMLLDITPDIVAKRFDESGVYGKHPVTGKPISNYLDWNKLHIAYPQLTFVKRVDGYNNDEVKNNLPCLVQVDFDGSPRTDDKHWVLFIGNKRMYDPWTGQERATTVYPLTGYSIVKKG